LKQYERKSARQQAGKNPQNSTSSLQVTGAKVFQTPHVKVRYHPFLLVILLGLASQIKIFGEAPPNSKSETKITNISLQTRGLNVLPMSENTCDS
jgi:hypothetical protein